MEHEGSSTKTLFQLPHSGEGEHESSQEQEEEPEATEEGEHESSQEEEEELEATEKQILEKVREVMARDVLTKQEANGFVSFILRGSHPYHRAVFLADIGVTQTKAANLSGISRSTLWHCLKLRDNGEAVVPFRGRPRGNLSEPHAFWDSLKADQAAGRSLPAAYQRLLKVRKQLEEESLKHASFHYYVTRFWLPFIKKFHGHHLPYTLPVDKRQYYDVNVPEENLDQVPVPLLRSSERCIGDADEEEEFNEQLLKESLYAVAGVLYSEPSQDVSGTAGATVRQLFESAKRKWGEMAALNLGQVQEDLDELACSNIRGHSFNPGTKRRKALAEIRKKKAEKATATAAAVSLLALHSSPDDEEEGGVEEDPQHHDTLGNTSNDESIVRSHGTDAETSSFASEEEQLRCRTDDFCPTTFLENNSSVG